MVVEHKRHFAVPDEALVAEDGVPAGRSIGSECDVLTVSRQSGRR